MWSIKRSLGTPQGVVVDVVFIVVVGVIVVVLIVVTNHNVFIFDQ